MSAHKFKSSREIVHQIRWDARFDARKFTIGYEDRRVGTREIPLLDFVPDGDIPWHRVWTIRQGDTLVWDRRTRLDRLTAPEPDEALPAPPRKSRHARHHNAFYSTALWRFDPQRGRWAPPRPSSAPPSVRALRIASLNVLVDHYRPGELDTERRTAATLETLRDLDADLISLQEVTAPFLKALTGQPWVRERYTLTDRPEGDTVQPLGQLILSRLPTLAAWRCDFSPQKRVIIATVALPGGHAAIAAVHLTSNYRQHNSSKRARQLQVILDHLDVINAPVTLITGDLNCEDDLEEMVQTRQRGLADIWPALHPLDPGFTFDPVLNTLAEITSTTGDRRRYDRALLRARAACATPRSAALFAQTPLTDGALFLSDHFGLVCDLDLHPDAPAIAEDPVHQSAAALLLPPDAQPAVQAIRQRFDAHVDRWMPHVNLLYGFVPEAAFARAAAAFARALGPFSPFDLILDGFGLFEHRATTTAWLRVTSDPPGRLDALQSALQSALPQCNAQSLRSPDGFTPHLTLGQFPTPEAARAQIDVWRQSWRPLRFPVHAVHLLSRRGDDPFQARHHVPLGQRDALDRDLDPLYTLLARQGALPDERHHQATDALIDELRALCAEALRALHPDAAPCELLVAGSRRMGTDLAASDLDLVALAPHGADRIAAFHAILAALTPERGLESATLALDAQAPDLKLTLRGRRVDLQLALLPPAEPPTPSTADDPAPAHPDSAPTPQNHSTTAAHAATHAAIAAALDPSTPDTLADLLAAFDPSDPDEALFAALDPPSLLALQGCAEADALAAAGARAAGRQRFEGLARAVKRWAAVRGLDNAAFGGLGGISWAILAAWTCQRAGALDPQPLLERFFAEMSTWDWDTPLGLTDDAALFKPRARKDRISILTATAPSQNTARNITRSTRRLLRREFERAWDRLHHGDLEGLFDPAHPGEGDGATLLLHLRADNDEALDALHGALSGRALGLLIDLERHDDLEVRPYPPAPRADAIEIGLRGSGAADRRFIDEAVGRLAALLTLPGLERCALTHALIAPDAPHNP